MNIKYCPFMIIADNIGREGQPGAPFLNVTGTCMGELCGIYNRQEGQCGLISREVPVPIRGAEDY